MKIRKEIYLEDLEEYGYHYESNLAFPTYQKIIMYGYKVIKIEVLIHNRMVFINRSNHINEKNINFVRDLITNNLVER